MLLACTIRLALQDPGLIGHPGGLRHSFLFENPLFQQELLQDQRPALPCAVASGISAVAGQASLCDAFQAPFEEVVHVGRQQVAEHCDDQQHVAASITAQATSVMDQAAAVGEHINCRGVPADEGVSCLIMPMNESSVQMKKVAEGFAPSTGRISALPGHDAADMTAQTTAGLVVVSHGPTTVEPSLTTGVQHEVPDLWQEHIFTSEDGHQGHQPLLQLPVRQRLRLDLNQSFKLSVSWDDDRQQLPPPQAQ
jgi:hypothetical protein